MLTIVSALPYMRDIVKGRTKPNLVTWTTWTLLTGIATAAAFSADEYIATIYAGAVTLQTVLIVLLALRYGYVKYTLFDVACQVAAIVGIVLWQIFNSPTIGVIAAVVIDFIGALPTFRHAWRKPKEETWQAFALVALGGAFAVAALTTYNWVNMPYAVYIVVVNTVLSYIIITRRKRQTR